MDDINRSISKHIKEGKYYEDARLWYVNRFVLPMSERTYLLIVMGVYIFALMVSWYYYVNTKPAEPGITYMLPTNEISTTYAVINPVGSDKETPQIGINKYVISNYVKTRESYYYDAKEIQNQLRFIQNTTVGTEFLKYKSMTSDNNPNSPIMIYQDKYRRSIAVKKVDLIQSSSNTQQAMVYFQSDLKNLASNRIVSQDFLATIDFKIENIEMLMQNNDKRLGFLVTKYHIREITK
ncbi:MAG: type IV secretion system protein [Rickettsiales bacterium]|jgi:type IV secretory pathway component VirB8|nr:type IV secretion system protein [Rickettsiales bacterium]